MTLGSSVIRGLAAFHLFQSILAIPYSEYILAPPQRVLSPVSVHHANGSVTNANGVTTSGSGSVSMGPGSAVTYDYSKNIGGLVSFTVSNVSGSNEFIGISFSESSFWISPDGSDATQNVGIDQTLWFQLNGTGNYTVDDSHQRGGFRYLNVYHNSSGNVALSSLTTNFTAMPHYADDALQGYTGYFHCNDEKLNRVWYAAAYTDQLCTIPSGAGNSLVDLQASDPNTPTLWWANSTLTNGTSALVDGAKRDKLIWPGDFGISLPGVFLSTNDQYTLKLSVQQLFSEQNASTGQLQYAATPIYVNPPDPFFSSLGQAYSYTYHLYNILALNNYYIYSGDLSVLQDNWSRIKFALAYSLSSVDSTGLAYVAENATADWLRVGMGAHNIEANSILRFTINSVINLAYAVNDTEPIVAWTAYAEGIKTAANELLWDNSAGLYTDNQTTTLHPQDGNVWAIISGVANASQASTISTNLAARWGPYGAPAPEAGTTVSPFISGFELQAHFLAGQPQHAIDLMRFMWADFMLDDPRMTNSTFNEGYDVSGALHYPAYQDDARISHAHGWATGPLIALSNYAAGLHVLNSSTWVVHPQPGNLSIIDAGFATAIGAFSATYQAMGNQSVGYNFSTPQGTTGTVILDVPACNARMQMQGGNGSTWSKTVAGWSGAARAGAFAFWGPPDARSANGTGTVTISDVAGGNYTVSIVCENGISPSPTSTGGPATFTGAAGKIGGGSGAALIVGAVVAAFAL
ncbi:glycoside hydrolase family 78 protein [Glonium stellatum]|uniref:Glycoside hydrolase family 78 protein n=1 Tax=Glonium stellatum TaxID=574774 RepID=A0A8E2JLI5_9PEZI|nr:glycoside hydrolase family 78 protein [Glonium stellatum]